MEGVQRVFQWGKFPFFSLRKEGAIEYFSPKDCGVSELGASGLTSPDDVSVAVPVDELPWH